MTNGNKPLSAISTRTLPPIDLLRAFEACARHASVSRAAEELHLTQSAVSRQLAALEALLELQLFHRVRRRLAPTLAGSAYAPKVRVLLSELETATLQLKAHGGAGGTLTLSVVPTFGTRWLVPRLPRFRTLHPRIMLNLQNFETRPKRLDFFAEHVQGAIWFGEKPWPGTLGLRLADEEVLPVCAPAVLAAHPITGPQSFGSHVLLQNSTRPDAWQHWLAAAGATGVDGWSGPRFQHMAMIIQAAVVGLGVALAPAFLIADELAAGRLVVAFDHPVSTGQSYFLVFPEDFQDLPPLRAFCDWLLSERV